MTKKLYLDDTYLFESESILIDIKNDEKGNYILLDQTIFYPQGGGQPCDNGILILKDLQIPIISVKNVADEIRHYVNIDVDKCYINQKFKAEIDVDRRILNAKYHTAGHFIGNIVELYYPKLKAIKGHSFPGEAYIEFTGDVVINQNEVSKFLNESIKTNTPIKKFEISSDEFEKNFYKLPYSIPNDKKFRAIQIGEHLPIPCGGTHIKNLNEISHITIRKITVKNNNTKILYEAA